VVQQRGLLSYLITKGINVNLQDKDGNTCLLQLLKGKSNDWVTIATALLDAGADCTLTDVKQRTPLHLAVDAQHPELVELLLTHKASSHKQLSMVDSNGHTPLRIAHDKWITATNRSWEGVYKSATVLQLLLSTVPEEERRQYHVDPLVAELLESKRIKKQKMQVDSDEEDEQPDEPSRKKEERSFRLTFSNTDELINTYKDKEEKSASRSKSPKKGAKKAPARKRSASPSFKKIEATPKYGW